MFKIAKHGRNDRYFLTKLLKRQLQTAKYETPTMYRHIYRKILACGPITISEYMKEILTHPQLGYYSTKDVFGSKGDFITSPEISQLFGEMIGVWIVSEWQRISPNDFQLIELGPGRGTLMKDILRVFKMLKVLSKVSIHLVELSPKLSLIQADALCIRSEEQEGNCYRKGVTKEGVEIYWYYTIEDVPKNFSIILAQEFFDALPIHKFQRIDDRGAWHEVLIDIIENSEEEKFRYVLAKTPTPSAEIYISKTERRNHLEINPQSILITNHLSKLISEYGGFVLIIDYGHTGEKTDTFRAFKDHKLQDPLLNPGTSDLTADVDFSKLKQVAEKDFKTICFGPASQNQFLHNLGIEIRLKELLKTARTEKERTDLVSGYRMITDDNQMGEKYKVLSIFPEVLNNYYKKQPVAGFQ